MGEHDGHGARRCSEALQELYLFLDGELTAERITTIRAHLEECSPCLGAFDFEAELRVVVARRCTEKAPESLRQRVLQALADCDDAAGAPD